MPCQIDYLAKFPDLIPILASWHQREWQHLNPDSYSIEARIAEYQDALEPDRIPVMLVAHDSGKPLGSVRLIDDDMESHPELAPWLASLYVHPHFRRQGIATQLVRETENLARQLGYEQLFLYTEDRDDLYQALGWNELFREQYYEQIVTVMSKVL